jgi:hypothetical protein
MSKQKRVCKEAQHERDTSTPWAALSVPPPPPRMTAKAAGHTYADFIAAGWTPAQLVEHGYVTKAE